MNQTVYILDVDYKVKDEIPWQEAVTHIINGRMKPFKSHPTLRIRSAGGGIDMARPMIARLNYKVNDPVKRVVELHSRASRAEILRRDGRTCAYCGDYANTIDHILPQSRGGDWSYGNLVAACRDCNQTKADRTPEEAGMKLLWQPYVSTERYTAVQAEVDAILAEGEY